MPAVAGDVPVPLVVCELERPKSKSTWQDDQRECVSYSKEFAELVLMLSPPGTLADRPNAMLKRNDRVNRNCSNPREDDQGGVSRIQNIEAR